MHFNVRYDVENKAAAEEAAMKDIRKWLGAMHYNRLSNALRNEASTMNYDQFRIFCSFLGIQGYPVEVWASKIGIKEPIVIGADFNTREKGDSISEVPETLQQ